MLLLIEMKRNKEGTWGKKRSKEKRKENGKRKFQIFHGWGNVGEGGGGR